MQIAPDRVSAAHPEVHYPGNRERSFCAENFPQGVLLPGLPLHVGKRRRSATAARALGNVLLTGASRRKLQARKHQAPEKLQIPNSKLQGTLFADQLWFLVLGISLELGAWSLELRQSAVPEKSAA